MEQKVKRRTIGIVSLVLLVIYLFLDSRVSVEYTSWNWVNSVSEFLFYFWVVVSAWIKVKMILDSHESSLNKGSIILFICMLIFAVAAVSGGSRESDIGSLTLIFAFILIVSWPAVDVYDYLLFRTPKW